MESMRLSRCSFSAIILCLTFSVFVIARNPNVSPQGGPTLVTRTAEFWSNPRAHCEYQKVGRYFPLGGYIYRLKVWKDDLMMGCRKDLVRHIARICQSMGRRGQMPIKPLTWKFEVLESGWCNYDFYLPFAPNPWCVEEAIACFQHPNIEPARCV